MEKVLSTGLVLKRLGLFVFLAIVLILAGSILSGMMHIPLEYGSYLVAVFLLALTWLLYSFEGKNLNALGLGFKKKWLLFIPLGLLIGMLICAIILLAVSFITGFSFHLNSHANYLLMLGGVLILLPQVVVEELLFRGYAFKKVISISTVTKANILFALLFIISHMLGLAAWNDWKLMLGLFVTGFGHLLFASALLRSGTLYFPIAIHLGYNWASRNIFSSDTTGVQDRSQINDSLFYITGNNNVSLSAMLIANLFTAACFVLFAFVIWKWKKNSMPAMQEY